METQVVNLVVKGTTYLHVTILRVNHVQYIPSFIILPKNRGIFKQFDRSKTKGIRFQGISYYKIPNEITIQML